MVYSQEPYEDIELECSECGGPFTFTAKDQKFYEEKDFVKPKRCRGCRAKKKERMKKY